MWRACLQANMHTTSKRITRRKQNSCMLQTKEKNAANKTPAHYKQNSSMLQTKVLHNANKTPARCKQKNYIRCKQNSYRLQTKAKTLHAQDDIKDWELVLWFSCFTTNMAEFLQREIHAGVMKTQTSQIYFSKKKI